MIRKKTFIEILLLLVVSSALIFFKFNNIPNKLSYDEVQFALLAQSLDNKPYTPYSSLATGHSTLYFYFILLSIKMFGQNSFALRFPSAAFGVFSVIIFYLILVKSINSLTNPAKNKFLNKNIPLSKAGILSLLPFFLALTLASLRWYFSFARFSFEPTFLLFLELTSILFLFVFFNCNKIIYLVISALFAGFAFNSYYPGRIFFILPVWAILAHFKNAFRKTSVIVFLIIFSLIILPLSVHLTLGKDIRIDQQLLLKDKQISVVRKTGYIGLNALKLALMFTLRGDMNGRHNYPGKSHFNPIFGAFFLFGFVSALFAIKNFYNQFFILYFIISLIPAMLTYPWENPNSLRAISSIIPSVYFAGYGIIQLLESQVNSKKVYFLILSAIIILFVFSASYEMRTYFVFQKNIFRQAFEFPGGLQKIISLRLWEKMHFE